MTSGHLRALGAPGAIQRGAWGEIAKKYDIFLKVSSQEPHGIDKIVEKLRSIKQITDTSTMPVLYGQGGTIDE